MIPGLTGPPLGYGLVLQLLLVAAVFSSNSTYQQRRAKKDGRADATINA